MLHWSGHCSADKESACNARDRRRWFNPWVGQIPWRRKMETHSSILAWKIPLTEKPSELQSKGWQRVRHDWVTKCTHTRTYHSHQTHPFSWTLQPMCYLNPIKKGGLLKDTLTPRRESESLSLPRTNLPTRTHGTGSSSRALLCSLLTYPTCSLATLMI